MSASFNIHGVYRIEVSAYTFPYFEGQTEGRKTHVQNIYLYDENDRRIGDIGIFLEDPNAAMRVGNLEKLDIEESYVSL
jgi:hypothetical protein